MQVLPKELNYAELPPVVESSCKSSTIFITPSNNKSSFSLGEWIDFDFPTRGFIDGKSLCLNYNVVATNDASGTSFYIFGTPAYTPLSRIEESIQAGTKVINTMPMYHQTANDLVQLSYSVADKYGNTQLGWKASGNATTNDAFDARYVSSTTAINSAYTSKFPLSCPLIGTVIYNSEKFICLKHTGGYRMRVYLEPTLSNVVSSTSTCTGFTIQNPYLAVDLITVSEDIQRELDTRPYVIKSNTFVNAQQPVPASSVGTLQLSYANVFSSLKNVIIHPQGQSVNKWFDAVDVTATESSVTSNSAPQGGSYQLQIRGSELYPAVPLNSGNNRAHFMSEMKKAYKKIFDNNNISINQVEFNHGSNATTTASEPAKFFPVIDTSKISAQSNNLLNGINTAGSNINLLLQMYEANTSATAVNLIFNYDVLLNVDPLTNNVSLSV